MSLSKRAFYSNIFYFKVHETSHWANRTHETYIATARKKKGENQRGKHAIPSEFKRDSKIPVSRYEMIVPGKHSVLDDGFNPSQKY